MRFVTRVLARSQWFVPLLLTASLLAAARPATGGPPAADTDPSLAEETAVATTRKDPGRGRVDPSPADPRLPGTAATTTSLTMDSEPGDYIGGGQHHSYTTADGSFSVIGASRNRFSIRVSGGSHNWNLDFAAPNNAPLAVGTYTGATVSNIPMMCHIPSITTVPMRNVPPLSSLVDSRRNIVAVPNRNVVRAAPVPR